MNRNSKTILAKATECSVENMGQGWFTVTSPSGAEYDVHRDLTGACRCNCNFGTCGGTRPPRICGCAHTTAVNLSLSDSGRKVYAHSGQEAAKRQRRPATDLGQDLWLTSRKS